MNNNNELDTTIPQTESISKEEEDEFKKFQLWYREFKNQPKSKLKPGRPPSKLTLEEQRERQKIYNQTEDVKEWRKKYNQTHRETVNEISKKYKLRTRIFETLNTALRVKIFETLKEYKKPLDQKEINKRYSLTHKKEICAYKRKWRLEHNDFTHRERANEISKKWYLEHKDSKHKELRKNYDRKRWLLMKANTKLRTEIFGINDK